MSEGLPPGFRDEPADDRRHSPRSDATPVLQRAAQIIVLVHVEGRTLAVYRDDVKGRVVTVNLGLPSGLSLLELRATIDPHARGRGKKRRLYFRTPPVCPPSGEWTTTVIFTYLDGSSQQLADGSPCRRT